MSVSPNKFAIASAVSFGAMWVLCSLFVQLFPNLMLDLTSYMLHIDMHAIGWQLSPHGAVIGLIAWSALAGFAGWALATAYKYT